MELVPTNQKRDRLASLYHVKNPDLLVLHLGKKASLIKLWNVSFMGGMPGELHLRRENEQYPSTDGGVAVAGRACSS